MVNPGLPLCTDDSFGGACDRHSDAPYLLNTHGNPEA